MPPQRKHSTVRWVAAVLAILALVGGAVAVADPDDSVRSQHGSGGSSAGRVSGAGASAGGGGSRAAAGVGSGAAGRACGAASAQTITTIDAQVAHKIYMGELTGHEVGEDVAHVTGSQELLSALASGDQAALYNAVHTIVYTPHWHIVRLRVRGNGGALADVGGPYIIAPIKGSLRQGAAKLGSYVVSVQDDAGYIKLVTRFVGVPIDLYGTPPTPPPRPAGKFLMGTLQPAPPLPADGASVKAGGASYLARIEQAAAFPSGKLSVALFVPTPPRSLTSQSCAAVRNAAWGNIVKHVAARFHPLATHYQDFVGTLQGSTGGVAFVREGSVQIAGHSAGPRRLPVHGTVSYHGRTWQVFSWSPYPPARVYFLAPS